MSDEDSRSEAAATLKFRVKQHYEGEGYKVFSTVVVHHGPKAYKTATLVTSPDAATGEIRRWKLLVRTWKRLPAGQGGGYDFDRTDYHWHCDGEEEIEAVRLLLNDAFDKAGKYSLLFAASPEAHLLRRIAKSEVVPDDIVKLLSAARASPSLAEALARSPDGLLLAEAVELRARRAQLAELRGVVENPSATERDDIHPLLKKMGWVFGGRYVGEATRQQLTLGDVLDIPLLRADGSLHVVELKAAKIPRLVRRHRGPVQPGVVAGTREDVPLIVGPEVHEAVGQVMNYLAHLDEDRDRILSKYGLEARRASATVLIGHPDFVTDFTTEEVAATLRIYNSHLARIEVMHYAGLIDNAERALNLVKDVDQPGDADDGASPLTAASETSLEGFAAGRWAEPAVLDERQHPVEPWQEPSKQPWRDDQPSAFDPWAGWPDEAPF